MLLPEWRTEPSDRKTSFGVSLILELQHSVRVQLPSLSEAADMGIKPGILRDDVGVGQIEQVFSVIQVSP